MHTVRRRQGGKDLDSAGGVPDNNVKFHTTEALSRLFLQVCGVKVPCLKHGFHIDQLDGPGYPPERCAAFFISRGTAWRRVLIAYDVVLQEWIQLCQAQKTTSASSCLSASSH